MLTIRNSFLTLLHVPFAHFLRFVEIVRSYSQWKQPSCPRMPRSREISSSAPGVAPSLAARPERSDKLTVHGMHDGLKPIVSAKLLVDVVKMVAERLQGNSKGLRDFCRIPSVGEPAEYALLLFGE